MADNASDAPIVEMTTKMSWRVLNVVFVVACAVAGVTAGGVSPWVGLLSGSVLMVGAFRDYIRVEDGVLFRRTIKGWDPPMVLATSDHRSNRGRRGWITGISRVLGLSRYGL